MKKRILAILLCLTMVSSMLPVSAIAEGNITIKETAPVVAAACEHQAWTQWDGTGAVPASGNVVLTDNVQLSNEYLLDGTTLTICLNGHNITAASGKRVFTVKNGAHLTVYDCAGTGKITGAKNVAVTGAAVQVEKNSQFDFHGGNISGNTSSKDGCGVYVAGAGATFNMYGGTISNNTTTAAGGGVCAGSGSVVNITGGSITGNTAANGGGVILQGTNPVVLLKDCSITGNTGTSNAGGVYVGYKTPDTTVRALTFSGDVVVTGNVGGSGRIAANVQFMNAQRVAYQIDLGANANIGVRKNDGAEIIAEGATAATVGNYTSDAPTKILVISGGKLTLADKPAEAVAHANTAGYTACNHANTTWAGWYQTGSLPTESGAYYLTGNVTLTDTWTISAGQTITICLNGQNITQSAAKRLVRVTNGTLNICDCTAKTENGVYSAGKLTGANTSDRGAGVTVEAGATFNLYDGCISGNTSSSYGGGVYVIGTVSNNISVPANFNMYGGSVDNNHANSQSGGGVCINGNTNVNIIGGSITANTAKNGGGIIAMGANNVVLLKDCAITSNTATDLGGGVYVGKPDCVTLSGTLNITGNTKGGEKSNLFICSTASEARPVVQNELNTASTIGISIYLTTKSNVLVKSGVTEETAKCYTPDDSNKLCKLENGKLLLVDKPAFTPNHADTQGYVPGDHGNVTWTDWVDTGSLPTNSGNYYLYDDVELTDTWKISAGQTITLCLNGHSITQTTTGKRIIEVTNGTLNICDCAGSGRITGANVTVNGGAIIANGGNANVNLYDITLSGNNANNGGALSAHGGSAVTLNDVIVTGNTAASQGGGVYVVDNGTKLTLNNVTVTGNTTLSTNERAAGGVHVNAASSTTLKGKVIITDNFKGTGDNKIPSNMEIDYNRSAIDDALSADSSIGLSVYPQDNTRAVHLVSKAAVNCYFPDDDSKITKVQGDILHLVNKPTFTPNHADTQGYVPGDHGNVTWIDWIEKNSLPSDSGHYYLVYDVELTSAWNAGDGKDITICLNGHNVTQLTDGQRLIRVGSSTVNICDCTAHMDGETYVAGQITGGKTTDDGNTGNAGAMMLTNGGTFRLYDGIITGNHTDGNGVIVIQKNFVFEMYGGRISGNTATGYGAGLYITGAGEVKLAGGEITGNTTNSHGGGIYLNNGTVEMSDGKISGNAAANGAAVMISGNGTFLMEGGSIENNIASGDGGVYVYGTFQMTAGQISGNTAANGGGGGIAAGSGANVSLTGGQITGNTAKNGGGMILQGTDPVVVLKNVKITGNTATSNGGGVYVANKVSDQTLEHMTLGGKVQIINNTVNGVASNLLLGAERVIYHENLSDESVIGMGTNGTMPKEVVRTGAKEEDLSCYTSDIYGRTFELRGESIWMIVHPDAVHQPHEECGHQNVQWTEWASQTSLPTAAGHYYLIADVALTKIWSVGEGQEVTLCLNGHSITQSTDGLRVLRVAGSTLNVCDCQNTGVITGGNTDASDASGSASAAIVLKQGTFRLYGGKITGNTTEGNGTLVVQQESVFEMHGGEISGNTVGKQGGAVYLSKSTMTMTGGKIVGNTAAGSGGGVYNNGGSLTLEGGAISENESTAGGGGGVAIKDATDGTKASFTLSGGEVSKNISKLDGSGIRMDSGKFAMTGGKITGNGHEDGYAGGANLLKGEATISGGVISGNIGRNAAGLMVACDLTMTGGEITGNIGSGNGAGVYVSGSTFYLKGGKITKNQAGGRGAGVFVTQGVLEMSGGWILNNTAASHGGGVATLGGTIRMSEGLIKDNVSSGGGGGIYTENRMADDKLVAETVIELSGGKVYGNSSKLMGGGIRMDNGKITISGGEIAENKAETDVGGLCVQNGTVTITDCRIVKNTAGNAAGAYFNNCDVEMSDGLISTNMGGGNGAGVYVAASTFKFSGGSIRFNESTGNGGGIFASQSEVEISGGEIRSNKGGMAGGVYNLGGKLTVKGGVIKTNDAYKLGGGGIYCVNRFAEDKTTVIAEASLTISGGEISGNKSKTDGAGVRVDSGKFEMTNGLISANEATGSCGGMSLRDTDAVISGGTITKNKANNAAGVYITSGSLTITGGEISHNAGNGSGAGILASSADVKFSGGVIEENYAKGDGAGLYISNGKLTLCGGKINKNRAEKMCGGVLAAKNSRVYFTGGAVSGNTAKGSCGGIMIQTGSTMQMSGGTVSNNIAVNYGGGIYVNKTSSLTLSGGTISGNAARKGGGGVYVGADSNFTMTGGKITKNDATTQGGGLTIVSDATISGGTISENTSKKEGAGFYISNATVTFSGGSVEGNVTEYNGGGICVRGEKGILKISDDAKILNNKCKESGGGILVQGQGTLKMTGGEISGNFAPNGGGGIRLHNCAAEISGAKINDNISNGQGAGIYSNLSLILKDSEVCNNKIVADENIKLTRSSAAIRTHNESTLEMENVKVSGNTCDGRAGAMEVAYDVDATIKNCTFTDNTATEQGGTFYIYWEGQAYLYDCTIEGSSAPQGGAVSMDAWAEIEFHDCLITENQADVGAVAYQAVKARAVFDGCTIKKNVAKQNASAIWANGDVVLKDTLITENMDKSGTAAVYLTNETGDTESYIPGVYEIMGNTQVYGNDGGDLVLTNNAFINIPGDGLGANAKVQVKLQDEDITRWIIGPYNYEVSGDGFLLTQGEQSLSDAYMGSGETVTEEENDQQQTSKGVLPLAISGGVAVVLLAVALSLVAMLRKKKAKAK